MAYGRFLLKRGVQGVLVVRGVVTIVFGLRFITPGSPVNVVAPLDASQELRRRIAQEMGLNGPIWVQYGTYIWERLHGEMGYSYISDIEATVIIFSRLPESLVRYRHALRSTLIPVVTVLGLQLGTLIGGAVITEAVFAWPGLGSTLIAAINARDWPIIQGTLIVIGVGFVLVNTFVDALYAYLDPQVVTD